MSHIKILSLIVGGSLMVSLSASAAVFVESGDAGETLAGAQMVGGGITQITGSYSGDADMFGFYWGGGSFYANTTGSSGDTQLFLFNNTGAGVWGNDDGISSYGPAYISDASLAAGDYYLGVSGYNYDPSSASGVMFQSYPYAPIYGPENGTETLSSWDGHAHADGTYSINFQRITADGAPVGNPTGTSTRGGVTQVPEPGSIALMSLGLLGLGLQRRRKNRNIR